jgi:acyl carrier protein
MTGSDLEAAVRRALHRVAPEADLGALDPRADVRDQLDIDSMDFLNFVIGIQRETGVDVPETDYPQLRTLAGCVAYLERRRRSAG